jgi:hypothetical protein
MQTLEELKSALEEAGFAVEITDLLLDIDEGYVIKSRSFALKEDLVELFKKNHMGARKIYLYSIEEMNVVDYEKTSEELTNLLANKTSEITLELLKQFTFQTVGKIRYDAV